MKMSVQSLLAVLAIALLATGTNARKLQQDTPVTLASVLAGNEDLSVLLEAVKAVPDLLKAAQSPDTAVTLFAPTNQALLNVLAALGLEDLNALLASGLPVADILTYHVVGAPVMAKQLEHGAAIFPLLAGKRLIADLLAGASPIIRAVNSAANVTEADVPAGKSVIHIIDAVLLPINPAKIAFANVAEAAVAANLTSLVAALEKANLTAAVADPELVATILAPTNEAFAAALAAFNFTLETIPVDVLTKVLTYHVAPGYGPTARMVGNGTVGTLLADQTLAWQYPSMTSSTPTVVAYASNATIVAKDVFAGKSVVHVIDTVLVPDLSS